MKVVHNLCQNILENISRKISGYALIALCIYALDHTIESIKNFE